ALFRGDLDVPGREQEDLVRDALHRAVERVGQSAGEVDQLFRELRGGALQVEDDRHGLLELVRDRLRVVEAPRHDEMDADRRGGDGLERPAPRPLPDDGRVRRGRVRLGPVLELLPALLARREPAHVRAVATAVGPLELLLGGVRLLVPVIVLLDDAEVDEGAAPYLSYTHDGGKSWRPNSSATTRTSVAPSSAATR